MGTGYEYFTDQASDIYSQGRSTRAYRDFDISMEKNPLDNDVLFKTGVASIKQSLQNLVLLNHYEKPFHEDIGSDIYKLLFENYEPDLDIELTSIIKEMARSYEKRAEILDVQVDSNIDNNGLYIQIFFKPLDTLITDSVRFFLQINR